MLKKIALTSIGIALFAAPVFGAGIRQDTYVYDHQALATSGLHDHEFVIAAPQKAVPAPVASPQQVVEAPKAPTVSVPPVSKPVPPIQIALKFSKDPEKPIAVEKKDTKLDLKPIKETIEFKLNSARLDFKAKEKLNRVAMTLKAKEQTEGSLAIKGFTCDLGTRAYNKLLSKKRAVTTAEFLKEQGVMEKMIVTGEGECCFISKEHARNRRVEITTEGDTK